MDVTKFIIDCLNKPPFSKLYSFITFNSLQPEELIQILSDVILEISGEEKIDIRFEDPEQTIIRLLNALRIFQYKPDITTIDASNFKRGLINGEKIIIHPILKWLLSDIDKLKNRAYLSKFLVKIVIPNDVLGDSDIATLYQQYELLIEEFTNIHKELTKIKDVNKTSISELISDCSAIEREKEIVSARVEQFQRKSENIPNLEKLLEASRKLRIAKEEQKLLGQQISEESMLLQRNHQQLDRTIQQLEDLKNNTTEISSNTLFDNITRETNFMSYLTETKLPREISKQKMEIEILQNIVSNDQITEDTNLFLKAKLKNLSEHIERLKNTNLNRDRYATKDKLAEEYFELKNLTRKFQEEVELKRENLKEVLDHVGISAGAEFQEYVKKLRAQSLVYKRQRTILANLKTECGVLGRTLKILESKENLLGVDSNESHQENFEVDENLLFENENEYLKSITGLTTNIGQLKAKLLPFMNDLKPLQDEEKELKADYEQCKKLYDRTAAALDSNLVILKNDVEIFKEEHEKMVKETEELKIKTLTAKENLERANREAQMYADQNNATQTFRERLNIKILEADKINKILKDEQNRICENEDKFLKQRQIWGNIYSFLEFKKKSLQAEKLENGVVRLEKDSETLVLS